MQTIRSMRDMQATEEFKEINLVFHERSRPEKKHIQLCIGQNCKEMV